MPILSREDLLVKVRGFVGENATDEALSLVEDICDTVTDMETRATDSSGWKQKYEQNDAEWRKKYRDRFFSSALDPNPNPAPQQDPNKAPTFDDLFSN